MKPGDVGDAVIFTRSPDCKSRPVSTHGLAEESWNGDLVAGWRGLGRQLAGEGCESKQNN